MKNKKIFLDQEEEESIHIGLVRLAKHLPDYELFFHLNNHNQFSFKRTEDVLLQGNYNDYYFTRFEAYDKNSKNYWRFISNKSVKTIEKKKQQLLFSHEDDVKYLLNNHQEVDYIAFASDLYIDFSLILLPEKLFFPIQEFLLEPEAELYQIIQYYE